MTILAIETSCDETAAAALDSSGKLLGAALLSQMKMHAEFGGVVPEAASRSHLEALPAIIGAVLQQAGLGPSDFDLYAATTGPGLAPALLVGASAARGLAAGARRPFHGVNHIEGHLASPFFPQATLPPHIALVASGGHTLLFDVEGFGHCYLLGRTLDDAAGEAFDKVARLLGLGYPGGPAIEKAAYGGDPAAFDLPRAMQNTPGFDFSFSGLKTAARLALEKPGASVRVADFCASFQEAVADALAGRLARALRATGKKLAAMSGGVSSNLRIREKCRMAAEKEGAQLVAAEPWLRTDNAVMIAHAALLAAYSEAAAPRESAEIFPTLDPRWYSRN